MQQKVFVNVTHMKQYFAKVIASLPNDLGNDLPDGTLVMPDDLPNPKRQKLSGSTIVPVATQQCRSNSLGWLKHGASLPTTWMMLLACVICLI